jgi:hypothetical protein
MAARPASHYWPLVVYEKTQPQFEVVRKILKTPMRLSIPIR